MTTKNLTILFIAGVLVLFSIIFLTQSENQSTSDQSQTPKVDLSLLKSPDSEPPIYQFKATLTDVTKGQEITGIQTNNQATGIAQATFSNGKYQLLATFKNLPDPQGTDFYEGWIVKPGIIPSIKSSGKAIKANGNYQNIFTSNQDLTNHDFYALTIEPDDGDPAPAEHILEGTMTKIITN